MDLFLLNWNVADVPAVFPCLSSGRAPNVLLFVAELYIRLCTPALHHSYGLIPLLTETLKLQAFHSSDKLYQLPAHGYYNQRFQYRHLAAIVGTGS